MSLGLFQEFIVFVSGVTQGTEDLGSVQDFVLLLWCESGELGGRGSPRFPSVITVVKLLLRLYSRSNKLFGRVALRVLSNIHDRALLQKQPTDSTR